MKRPLFVFLVLLLFTLTAALTAAAVPTATAAPPIGDCPEGFSIHPIDDEHHHDHHIGLETDLNGNGDLCVLMKSEERHVHVDDVIR